jgi:hypothetical protein
MTSKDFGQKIEMRRAFWAMGAATRLEVKLGALVRAERTRSDREEWTDVDVLAVHYSILTGLTLTIADCKTSRGRVAERLFWVRGVMHLIGARQAFLVREDRLSPAARQLALRLGISALGPDDRAALLTEVDLSDGSTPAFLTAAGIERQALILKSTPTELDRLQRYRDTGYWLSMGHRNLTTLPAVLTAAREHLAPSSPWSLPLVTDLAWLYLLACTRALVDVTALHLAEPSEGLANVVVGDERERRDKEYLAAQLRRLFAAVPTGGSAPPVVDVLPAYYGDLTDLMVRLLRRRSTVVGALRALEFAAVETALPRGTPSGQISGIDAYSWKLASDTVRFLVRAARLDRDLQEQFDELAARGSGQTGGAAPPVSDVPAVQEPSRATESPGAPIPSSNRTSQISLFVDPLRPGVIKGANDDDDMG